MSRYLDPKADVVFKKIFGERPHLLKSFLNAVLPLPEDGLIETLTYLPTEQVPIIPGFKSTIVDVKCKDVKGRVFIVEMQIQWSKSFMQRLLFGTSTAYVRQLEKGEDYHLLQPVYGLSLIGTIFDTKSDDWYHHYKLVNVKDSQRDIKDLQLIFIELPKFKPASISHKKLQVLWLRFMSELDERTKEAPAEWLEVDEIKTAVELSEEAAYTPAELAAYEKYWDAVSVEKTRMSDAKAEGEAIGIAKGKAEGKLETVTATLRAINLIHQGLDDIAIAAQTDLDVDVVRKLREGIIGHDEGDLGG
jgi:predicted transposase/invertase (TIGR01784 family)